MWNLDKNPQDLIAKIKQLEEELRKVKSCKRYWLVWEEKPEVFEEKAKDALPILKEDKTLRIEDSEQKSNNIIIEWDNFHSLSVLNYTHKWKIDVIYIDPPYNTWSSDWVYNNNYVDKEDTYRHSKWLSFMNKRLKLAKELLSIDWFLILTIDHYELFNIWALLDEILWEENRLWIVTVVIKPEWRQFSKFFSVSNEYMLVYAKNINFAKFNEVILDETKKKEFNFKDELGLFKYRSYINYNPVSVSWRYVKPKFWYPIYINSKNWKISLEKENKDFLEILPIQNWEEKTWQTVKETTKKRILNNELWFIKNKKWEYEICLKVRENQRYLTHWVDKKYNSNTNWTKIVNEIIWEWKFNFPKSLYAVKDILKITSKSNSTILDFFAWSWTTGHAVMELNKEDWWNRQFILCSSRENTKEEPDKNICKDITYKRNKKVILWYTDSKWKKVEWLGGNLNYYTTEFIKVEKSIDDLRYKFINMCDDLLCVKENTFTKIPLSPSPDRRELGWGLIKLFKKQNKFTTILYDVHFFDDLKEILKDLDWEISVYIFSLSNDIFEEELVELNKNITLQNIPDPILETYKKIFNF